MFVLAGVEPAEELVGGVWYKDNKEYDSAFVTTICKYLLTAVRKAVSSYLSTHDYTHLSLSQTLTNDPRQRSSFTTPSMPPTRRSASPPPPR